MELTALVHLILDQPRPSSTSQEEQDKAPIPQPRS
jgi:hypothetical protein